MFILRKSHRLSPFFLFVNINFCIKICHIIRVWDDLLAFRIFRFLCFVITDDSYRVSAEVDGGINIILIILKTVPPLRILSIESAVDVIFRLALMWCQHCVVFIWIMFPFAVHGGAILVRVSVIEIHIVVTDFIVEQLIGRGGGNFPENMILNISIKSRSQVKPGTLKCGLSSLDHNGGNDADDYENDDGAENTDGDDGVRSVCPPVLMVFVQLWYKTVIKNQRNIEPQPGVVAVSREMLIWMFTLQQPWLWHAGQTHGAPGPVELAGWEDGGGVFWGWNKNIIMRRAGQDQITHPGRS